MVNTNWLVLDQSSGEWVDSGKSGCDYCNGKSDPKSSDNPDKAIISLKNERETTYATYISVQNEIMGAYTHLRNQRSLKLYGISYEEMKSNWYDVNSPDYKSKSLKKKIDRVKKEYPQKFSEVE